MVEAVVERSRFSQKAMQAHSSFPYRDYHIFTSTSRRLRSNQKNRRDTNMVPAKKTHRRVYMQLKGSTFCVCGQRISLSKRSESGGNLSHATMQDDFMGALVVATTDEESRHSKPIQPSMGSNPMPTLSHARNGGVSGRASLAAG
jgi:hypothetical protein